ncbi:hypothetical protein [Clavibacter sp. km3a]|uniref:hypothetical protein n=1 Tax=Clavibacter sp. km3a TaxID=3459135 RepID=UPI004042C32D
MSQPWSFIIPGVTDSFTIDSSPDALFQPSAAVENILHQQELFSELAEARIAAGRSVEEAAEILGVEPEILQRVEAGSEDMTLSELRQFAYAADAVISYHVQRKAGEIQDVTPDWTAIQLVESMWIESGRSMPAKKDLIDAIRR